MDNDTEKRWYVVNTYSGHENKVKENLLMRAESMGMQDHILDVVVPAQKVIEERNGKKIEREKKLFPGYILVQMVMSDEAWYVVRNTPGVTGFIGSSGKGAKPTPVPEKEVQNVFDEMGINKNEAPKDLAEGDKVNIVDGPFKGMLGTVTSIDAENSKVELDVDLFGQVTSVEVELNQIGRM